MPIASNLSMGSINATSTKTDSTKTNSDLSNNHDGTGDGLKLKNGIIISKYNNLVNGTAETSREEKIQTSKSTSNIQNKSGSERRQSLIGSIINKFSHQPPSQAFLKPTSKKDSIKIEISTKFQQNGATTNPIKHSASEKGLGENTSASTHLRGVETLLLKSKEEKISNGIKGCNEITKSNTEEHGSKLEQHGAVSILNRSRVTSCEDSQPKSAVNQINNYVKTQSTTFTSSSGNHMSRFEKTQLEISAKTQIDSTHNKTKTVIDQVKNETSITDIKIIPNHKCSADVSIKNENKVVKSVIKDVKSVSTSVGKHISELQKPELENHANKNQVVISSVKNENTVVKSETATIKNESESKIVTNSVETHTSQRQCQVPDSGKVQPLELDIPVDKNTGTRPKKIIRVVKKVKKINTEKSTEATSKQLEPIGDKDSAEKNQIDNNVAVSNNNTNDAVGKSEIGINIEQPSLGGNSAIKKELSGGKVQINNNLKIAVNNTVGKSETDYKSVSLISGNIDGVGAAAKIKSKINNDQTSEGIKFELNAVDKDSKKKSSKSSQEQSKETIKTNINIGKSETDNKGVSLINGNIDGIGAAANIKSKFDNNHTSDESMKLDARNVSLSAANKDIKKESGKLSQEQSKETIKTNINVSKSETDNKCMSLISGNIDGVGAAAKIKSKIDNNQTSENIKLESRNVSLSTVNKDTKKESGKSSQEQLKETIKTNINVGKSETDTKCMSLINGNIDGVDAAAKIKSKIDNDQTSESMKLASRCVTLSAADTKKESGKSSQEQLKEKIKTNITVDKIERSDTGLTVKKLDGSNKQPPVESKITDIKIGSSTENGSLETKYRKEISINVDKTSFVNSNKFADGIINNKTSQEQPKEQSNNKILCNGDTSGSASVSDINKSASSEFKKDAQIAVDKTDFVSTESKTTEESKIIENFRNDSTNKFSVPVSNNLCPNGMKPKINCANRNGASKPPIKIKNGTHLRKEPDRNVSPNKRLNVTKVHDPLNVVIVARSDVCMQDKSTEEKHSKSTTPFNISDPKFNCAMGNKSYGDSHPTTDISVIIPEKNNPIMAASNTDLIYPISKEQFDSSASKLRSTRSPSNSSISSTDTITSNYESLASSSYETATSNFKLLPPPIPSRNKQDHQRRSYSENLQNKSSSNTLVSRNSAPDSLFRRSGSPAPSPNLPSNKGGRVTTGKLVISRSPSPMNSLGFGSMSRSVSPCSSLSSATDRSSTPRRIFPQLPATANLDDLMSKEQAPVVFDANLSFVIGCKSQIRQNVKSKPAHLDSSTASNYLSTKICDFLKRTDHVMDEWKHTGHRGNNEDDYPISEEERRILGKSKSAANIAIKGYTMFSRDRSGSRDRSRSANRARSASGSRCDSVISDYFNDDDTFSELDELSEMTADLAEEHSTATLATERLDAETSERLRLERELSEVQSKNKSLQQSSERLEMELLYARSDLNGLASDEEDAGDNDGGVYKQKYERTLRELEFTKRRLQQQHEDDLEQLVGLKKQLEKKLADAYEEVEEQRQVVAQWKRKVQKHVTEMNDIRLLLEEQNSRNNLLEKKQRKFDSETQLLQDELRQEKQARERVSREKEVILAEKYTVDSNLADVRLELELKEERLRSLQQEIDDLTFGGKEDEIATLRKQKQDCERRLHEQEEELDDLAGQVQMLEQAKVRLEMSLEQQKKEARREATQREEELEEVRGNAQKKVKALEAQLENEHEERTLLLREKHSLERRLAAIAEEGRTEKEVDEAQLQRLKRDLKRTKALLRDAQMMLERSKADNPGKAVIRQLRNQLDDLECARATAIKSKQSVESELLEVQSQLDEAQRLKSEAEDKANTATRERMDLRTQIEENEEELAEVLKKYRSAVQQLSMDQLALQEQMSLVSELESEKNSLKEQLAELTTKLESKETMDDSSSSVQTKRMELRVKELESKLEFEQTTRGRLEVQITRLKETVDKLQTDISHSRVREQTAQDSIRKLQRSLRELKDEHTALTVRESESLQKRKELEKKFESAEAETAAAKSDLRLALQRIEDLQAAIQGELEDSLSDHSDSDHDSYSSDESIETFLANHKLSPINPDRSSVKLDSGPRSVERNILLNSTPSPTKSSFA